MVIEIFSPKWFYGYDALTEVVSIVSVILIAFLSMKAYRFTCKKEFKFLSYSFFLIALSFLIKIATNLAAYFQPLIKTRIGIFTITSYNMERMALIFGTGYFFYRLTILLGFLIILMIALKIKNVKEIALLVFFIVITTLFSGQEYFIFHITCAFMLIFISKYFLDNWKKKRTESALTLSLSFLLILCSQVIFIFVLFNKGIYVVGELFQLVGYLMLLYTYLLVLKRSKIRECG